MTDEERHYAEWRLVDDARESDELNGVGIWAGLKLALKDYRLYLFIVFQHISLLSQTFQYFFPSILNTLGYGNIQTLLLTVPIWFGTFLVSLLVTWTSGKTGDRSIHIMCLMTVSCIGNIIAVSTTVLGARFFALFLMPMGAVSAYTILVTWVANSFIRPTVKRSASIAICNMIGNCASIYGAYMYPVSAAPRYLPGGIAVACVCLLVALFAFIIRMVHIRENKKLARLEESGDFDEYMANNPDVRGRGFRYII